MRVKLPLDQTNRIEVYLDKLSLDIKDLPELDSLMCSIRSPVLVVNPSYLRDINIIRCQRNSQYKLLAAIDLEGKTFGGNKIYKIRDMIEADGFDIGLTVGRNKIEMINEIKGIISFLSQAGKHYSIRWVINTKHGSDHIDKCINAIKESKCNYELISLLTDELEPDLAHTIMKDCRNKIGITKCNMKISGKPVDGLIKNDLNLRYQIEAKDLK